MGILRRMVTVGSSDNGTLPSVLGLLCKPDQSGPERSVGDEDDGRPKSGQPRQDNGFSALPVFKTGWTEYCNSTAIHGVRYFVEEGRTRCERVFWVLALALSLAGCTHFINKVHTKWRDTPVLVSFAERATSIYEVPFPAVTICPEVKFRRSEFNYTEVYVKNKKYMEEMERNGTTELPNITEKERRYLEAVEGSACIPLEANRSTLPPGTLDTLRELALPVDTVLHPFILNGGYFTICCGAAGSPIFAPVMTDEGLCYTFNMLSNRELFTPHTVQHYENWNSTSSQGWSLEGGYQKNATLQTYPHRATGHGDNTGLGFFLTVNKSDHDYLCRGPVQGFQILLHSPADVPHRGQQFFRLPLKQDVAVVVKPSMMTTSEGLRVYKPSQRQCFFPLERHLKYFQIYTQKNCELECLANTTIKMCGCVGFHMPRQEETSLCGPGMDRCYGKARRFLLQREAQHDLGNITKGDEDGDCNCLPACNSLEYDGRVSHFDFEFEQMHDLWNYKPPVEGEVVTHVLIYFNDAQFITSRRSELYAVTEFIANCGGLLGLFSGFSLISLIEILYHLSVRLWCNARRRQREQAEATPARPPALGSEDVEKQPPSENNLDKF